MLLKMVLITALAQANISLDFSLNSKDTSMKKSLDTELNKEQRFAIPNTHKEVVVIASDDIPANIPLKYQSESIKFKFKVYDNKRLISSPEVVTVYGKEAQMTMSESPGEMPSISLKVKATR